MGNSIGFKKGDLVVASLVFEDGRETIVEGEIVGKDYETEGFGYDWLVKISNYNGRRLKHTILRNASVWDKDNLQELFCINFDKSVGEKPVFINGEQYYLWCAEMILNSSLSYHMHYHEQKIIQEIFLLRKVK